MKKFIILIITASLFFTACRKEADYIPYVGENGKLAYSNYTEQFQYIWKTISTAYVFWDYDTVDWDAAYDRFLPQFEALDRKYQDSGYLHSIELKYIYLDLLSNLCDHHMSVLIKNLHPAANDPAEWIIVDPGAKEVSSRDYYIENPADAHSGLRTFMAEIGSHYNVAENNSVSIYIEEFESMVFLEYCLFTLPDGRKVPYLWTSEAAITPIMRELQGSPAAALIDRWLRVICDTPKSQLAGIILDTRANIGGFQDDLDYLVSPFLNERTEIMKTRYKEGPGRLEHSVWCPYYLDVNPDYHRDITADNIPYVVLTDINSASMGEIEPTVIKAIFPTSYIIGERTFGATGSLQSDAVDLTYGAPYGDFRNNSHDVYTSTFETLIGGRVREGEGLIPDKEVLRINDPNHSFKPQLDAALQYIQNH